MNVIAFYIAGAIAVIATVLVITNKNAAQALLYLAASLISVAVVFYDLGAPFMAALEVIIYAGSIIVLFIFVVMMLNLGKHATEAEAKLLRPSMWIGPTILAAILIGVLAYMLTRGSGAAPAANVIVPRQLSFALYGPYLLGVELSSILLMGALIGAYHLGWHKQHNLETQDVNREYTRSPELGRSPVRTGSGRTVGAA